MMMMLMMLIITVVSINLRVNITVNHSGLLKTPFGNWKSGMLAGKGRLLVLDGGPQDCSFLFWFFVSVIFCCFFYYKGSLIFMITAILDCFIVCLFQLQLLVDQGKGVNTMYSSLDFYLPIVKIINCARRIRHCIFITSTIDLSGGHNQRCESANENWSSTKEYESHSIIMNSQGDIHVKICESEH